MCTLKLPLSQGSVMPMDPGKNSPAARICKQRLKHREVLKERTRQFTSSPYPEKHAIPVCHIKGQRLSGGVVHHGIVPLEKNKSGRCAIKKQSIFKQTKTWSYHEENWLLRPSQNFHLQKGFLNLLTREFPF